MHLLFFKIKRVLLSEGVRQSLVTVVGNVLATGMSAVALLLISRMLGPEKFGAFGVGFALVMIINKINDFGINAAMVKFIGGAESVAEQRQLFLYTTRLKLIATGITVLVGLVLVRPLSLLLGYSSDWLVLISVLTSVASTWYEHLLSMLQALHRFSFAVLMNAIQAASKLLLVGMAMITGQVSLLGLFGLYMVIPAIPLIWFRQLLDDFDLKSPVPKEQLFNKELVTTMSRHAAVGFITAGLIENVDVLFVQSLLSDFETGLLAGVSRIAMVVLIVAYSLGTVLNSRVARYKSRQHLRSYLQKAGLLALAALAAFVVYLPFGELAIVWTIGPEYDSGLWVLHILMASSFLTIASIPFLALFYTLHAEWYFSVSGILQLIIIVLGNVLFVPVFGLEAAAWSRLVSKIFLLIFSIFLSIWLYNREYEKKAN